MGKNFLVFGKAFCQLSTDDMKKIKVIRKNNTTKQVNRITCNGIEKTVTTIYKISDFLDTFHDLLQGISADSVADTKTIQNVNDKHENSMLIDFCEKYQRLQKNEKVYCKRDLQNKLVGINLKTDNIFQVLTDYLIANGLPSYLLPDSLGKRENLMIINGLALTSKEIYDIVKIWASENNYILPFENVRQDEVFKRKDFHLFRKNLFDYAIARV